MICVSIHARVCLSSAPCSEGSLLCVNLLCSGAGACLHAPSHSHLGSPTLIPRHGPGKSAWLGKLQ